MQDMLQGPEVLDRIVDERRVMPSPADDVHQEAGERRRDRLLVTKEVEDVVAQRGLAGRMQRTFFGGDIRHQCGNIPFRQVSPSGNRPQRVVADLVPVRTRPVLPADNRNDSRNIQRNRTIHVRRR